MPELPEVETVCRVMRHALQGKQITHVEVVPDPIVSPADGVDPEREALLVEIEAHALILRT